jgi:hypothetical protein
MSVDPRALPGDLIVEHVGRAVEGPGWEMPSARGIEQAI